MNPKSLTTLLLGIVASLCLATQCPKEESPNELPPETQTGANTFGCYVNGELFVKEKGNLMANAFVIKASNTTSATVEALSPTAQAGTLTIEATITDSSGTELGTCRRDVYAGYPPDHNLISSRRHQTDHPETYWVKLLDRQGKIQKETKFKYQRKPIKAKSVKFNLSTLPQGTYFLHVEGAGKVQWEQIVKN